MDLEWPDHCLAEAFEPPFLSIGRKFIRAFDEPLKFAFHFNLQNTKDHLEKLESDNTPQVQPLVTRDWSHMRDRGYRYKLREAPPVFRWKHSGITIGLTYIPGPSDWIFVIIALMDVTLETSEARCLWLQRKTFLAHHHFLQLIL